MYKTKKSKCILCDYEGSMKIKSLIDNREIVMCPKCQFEFMDPVPTDEEIKNIYSKNYFESWGIGDGETKEVSNMKKNTFKHILKGIIPFIDSGNILDVGTATGFLLEEAKELGFEPYGIEISEYASNIAKSKFGDDKIYNGTLETHPFKYNFFDLITMCDVIEHVKDPTNMLLIANKLLIKTSKNLSSDKATLRGGGYVLITTPNTKSLTAKILKSKWHRYMLEHLVYFNKNSMKKIAEKTGFKVIKSYPCVKIVNLDFLYSIAKDYKQFLISDIVKILHALPLIKKVDFPVLMGELTYILKKVEDK